MESVSVSGVSVSVALIIQEFAEASQLFKKWRKQRARSKAVGQAELESSLYFGESSIDKKRRALMVEHGKKFDAGDAQSLASLFKIRTDFRQDLIDVLISAMAREEGKKVAVDPVALRTISEATQKATLEVMGKLSEKLRGPRSFGIGGPNPDDVLPAHPLPPSPPPRPPRIPHDAPAASNPPAIPPRPNKLRKSQPNNESQASLSPNPTPMSSQASLASSDRPPSASSSRASFERPSSMDDGEGRPRPTLNLPYPYASSNGGASSSQSLVRRSPSRSIISRMLSSAALAPRPYSNIAPLPAIPTIVPSYKCTVDSEDILEAGRNEVDRLWAMADSSRGSVRDKRCHSAPLVQEPWGMFDENEFEDFPPPSKKMIMPPPTEYLSPEPAPAPTPTHTSNELRPPLEIGKRIRSEPTITFSRPAPRFGRNVSGPLGC